MLSKLYPHPEERPRGASPKDARRLCSPFVSILVQPLSLVPLTPAAAPPNRLQGCVFTREFPLRIKRRGVEIRFAIDAPDPRATNPDPVLLEEVERAKEVKRVWRCFDALVSGRIGSAAELASLEGISDRYEAVCRKPA
jgi:hypothetical protein